MHKEELYEIRKQLIKQQEDPDALVSTLLSLLEIAETLPKEAVEESKINKTLKTILERNKKPDQDDENI